MAKGLGPGLGLANYVLKFRFISFAPILSNDISTLINILRVENSSRNRFHQQRPISALEREIQP